MKHVLYGLSQEAQDLLNDSRAAAGERCWCCGLPLPEDPPVIQEIKIGDETIKLHRYIFKMQGWVGEEFLQAQIAGSDEIRYYLGLRVKPDGILASGIERLVTWPVDVMTVFPNK